MMIYSSLLEFTSDTMYLFGIPIKYYALCILTGIIFATILGVREAKKFGIAPNLILDGVLICVPLAIVGARLYYVFTSFDDFIRANVWDTFLAIIGFEGGTLKLEGLAINGGIIVALIFVPIYCKKRNINILHVFDLLAPGLLIGQICGRWGNFFNQEAHGPAVTAATEWITKLVPNFIMDHMYFYDNDLKTTALWHPTFFYEAMWNLIAFITILVSRRINKKQRVGDSVAFYLLWYGLGRSLIIEPLRMDPLLFVKSIGPDVLFNRVNVVINLLLALAGLVWLILKHVKFKDSYYIETQNEIKENKIDGIICRLDESVVSLNRLISNAYYYTVKEKRNVELSDEDTDKLISVNPKEYFNEDEYAYYLEYFNSHLDQIYIIIDVKDFFKKTFKHNYKVAIISNYSKEVTDYLLEKLRITTFVSIIIDKELSENQMLEAFKAIKGAKNILVVSSLAKDIEIAKNKGVETCLIYHGNEIDGAMEHNPTHVVKTAEQLDNIIIE